MDFFFLLSQISGLLQRLLGIVLDLLIIVFEVLRAAVVFVWNALVAFAVWAVGVFRTVANFLRLLWDKFLAAPILKLAELLRRLRLIVERILAPVMRIILWVRRLLDEIFFRYVVPILNVIQTMRRVLLLFRLLGLKWAEKLDQRLLRLEVKISELFLEVRRYLNQVFNTLSLILDPDLLLTRTIFLGSAGKFVRELFALILGSRLGSVDPVDSMDLKRRHAPPSGPQIDAAMQRVRAEVFGGAT